jgi:ankyrin repeat protein
MKENNLQNLKKHQLFDLESPSCDRDRFRNLSWYPNQNMLMVATEMRNFEIVKWIVEEVKIDVNSQTKVNGLTALHVACYRNQLDIVRYLVEECKADVNIAEVMEIVKPRSFVMPPLYRACVNNSVECVQILLQNGAEIPFNKNI